MSKKWKYLIVLAGSIAFLLVATWSPWNALLYRGDGKFSDGLFFFPRYSVKFPDIALDKASENHFRSWGLPSTELDLILYVKYPEPKLENRPVLSHLPVTVEARLADARGKIVCRALGRPADGDRDGIWVLMGGDDFAGYWHYQCNDFSVSSFTAYDLMIRVSDVGSGAEKVVVTPTLRGGGTELP